MERCLEAVFAQTLRPSEVLVVDDGCTDRTVEIARRFDVRVLSHGVNRGLGAGRNTAIREARNPWIASLDSDCVASPSWLETLASRLSADPSLVGVGGRLDETNRTAPADAWRTKHMRQHWGDRPIRNPAFLFGNNNLFPKAALVSAGLYNEKLRTNFEDVAMSEALLAAGGALLYEPAAQVFHLRKDTLRSVLRANWKWRFFGYRNDIDLRGLAKGLVFERLRQLAGFLFHDVRTLDLPGAALSAVAVAYAAYLDVDHLVHHYGEPRIHRPNP
ncbi:MAG: glycosyltransferase [Acidobacteria bacterium]|nr:glycosyltransferase [Acidobacteriota bacterium]